MRTTIEIICAVQDSKPVTLEECKLALMVLSNINHFVERSLRELAESVLKEHSSGTNFRATTAQKLLEDMFAARKKPPADWLGPRNTPGTPEHAKEQQWAKNLFKKATGLDIDDPHSFEEQEKSK